MKRTVFTLLLINIFLSVWSLKSKAMEKPGSEGDTVIIRLKNRNKVMVITDQNRDLRSFRMVDVNRIISDVDSAFRADSILRSGGGFDIRMGVRDSVLVIRKNTTLGKMNPGYKAVIVLEEDVNDTVYREIRRFPSGKKKNFWNTQQNADDLFEIDLGWNNYLENGGLPSDGNKAYGLRPFSSNIVNLRFLSTILGRKQSQRFSATAGVEISWHNYKFENDVILRKGSENVTFEPFPSDWRMIKSKLTVSWLNLPLMLHYRAKKSSFHVAAGGFAGYRLGSHTKIKYSDRGDEHKDKEFTNFYLNSLQYGLRFQIGIHDVDLFASYNLNNLYSSGKGPSLTPFSFGFTL